MKNNTLMLIVLFIIFFTLAFFVSNGPLNIDILVNKWSANSTNDIWINIFNVIAWLGDTIGVIIICLFVLAYFYKKEMFLESGVLVSTMLLTVGSSTLVKYMVARIRPENMKVDYHGYSFPSGHATMAVLFYGLVFYFLCTTIKESKIKIRIGYLFAIFAILIMYSRIYLNVHWFSDVIGGVVLGSFWLIVGILVYKKFKK